MTDLSGNLQQVSNYYPFGMLAENAQVGGANNKYRYNGKELQDDAIGNGQLDWYDYGARFYDPAIGRWHCIDPMAEKYPSINPYNYCFNNPVNLFDPDGMDPDSDDDKKKRQESDEQKLIKYYQNIGYNVNSIEGVKDAVATIEKVNDVLAEYGEESSITQVTSSEYQKKIQLMVAAVNWFMPGGDRYQIVCTIGLGSEVNDVITDKLSPGKLARYKSTLESIGKDLNKRIDNTLGEMIDLSNKMSYYKSEDSRNTVTYRMLEQKWNIRRDRLFQLQDNQRVINHEIERVTILIYQNPNYQK
jgi:RHS repeat-associated protein